MQASQSNSPYPPVPVRAAEQLLVDKVVMRRRILSGTKFHNRLFRRSPVTRTIYRALAALAIVVAFGIAPAAAQTGQMFGELVGKVTDDQGGVLPGVTITLSGPAVMGVQTATTNERGQYRFPGVNSGTYKLTFQLAGFNEMVRD